MCYVDWLNPDATGEWMNQLEEYLNNTAAFDGLWTTENEPFGEVSGEVLATETLNHQSRKLEAVNEDSNVDQSWFYSFWPLNATSTYNLPFIPQFETSGNYDNYTLSLNGTHANDE